MKLKKGSAEAALFVFCASWLDYIEVDYNRQRRHSANARIIPAAFEAQRFSQ